MSPYTPFGVTYKLDGQSRPALALESSMTCGPSVAARRGCTGYANQPSRNRIAASHNLLIQNADTDYDTLAGA